MSKQVKKDEMQTTIDIVGVIDDNLFKFFLEETDKIIDAFEQYKAGISYVHPSFLTPFPSITLNISSYGGSTAIGGAILNRMNEMKAMGIEINTHCNFAYSMAFIIFINGVKRTAEKFSSFMNHGSASVNSGYIEEQKADVRFSEKMDELFESLIFENTKMPKERVEKARLCCDWFGYEEAIEMEVVNAGYEGCEPDWDEVDRKYNQALTVAIQTFGQVMEIEDEDDIISLLYFGMKELVEQEKKEDKKEENKKVNSTEVTDEELFEMLGLKMPEACENCDFKCPNDSEKCQFGDEEKKCCRYSDEDEFEENVGQFLTDLDDIMQDLEEVNADDIQIELKEEDIEVDVDVNIETEECHCEGQCVNCTCHKEERDNDCCITLGEHEEKMKKDKKKKGLLAKLKEIKEDKDTWL